MIFTELDDKFLSAVMIAHSAIMFVAIILALYWMENLFLLFLVALVPFVLGILDFWEEYKKQLRRVL